MATAMLVTVAGEWSYAISVQAFLGTLQTQGLSPSKLFTAFFQHRGNLKGAKPWWDRLHVIACGFSCFDQIDVSADKASRLMYALK